MRSLKNAEGVLCKFCHVHNFKTSVDGLLGMNVWRTNTISQVDSANKSTSRLIKWKKKINKIKLKKKKKNATRILNTQCSFIFRHQLYRLIYRWTRYNLQLLGKSRKQYHTQCMHFAKMQLVSDCYTVVLCLSISGLFIYKKKKKKKNSSVYLSDSRVVFLRDERIENSDYKCTLKKKRKKKKQRRAYAMFSCVRFFSLNFFTKAYVVGTHLNCIDKSMQFKWVPTTYAFIKR